MSSTQFQRILANCETIWGKGDYDLDVETDDWVTYWAVVKKDLGTSFGPPLTMTGACGSDGHAWRELDRMLHLWAEQKRSGQPMTDAQSLEIFVDLAGGTNRYYGNSLLGRTKERWMVR